MVSMSYVTYQSFVLSDIFQKCDIFRFKRHVKQIFWYNGLIRQKYYPCNGISSFLNAVPLAILVPNKF
jgi:hypothetical protein